MATPSPFGDCGCCGGGEECDLCSRVAAINAILDDLALDPICDYCGDLCGTLRVSSNFDGMNPGDYPITLSPGFVDGECGWRGCVTVPATEYGAGGEICMGITVDQVDLYSLLEVNDTGTPLSSSFEADSYTCDPMELVFPDPPPFGSYTIVDLTEC
jgi:hypothetical protein